MPREPIRDNRGEIPTYVMHKGELIHQPTGLAVPLPTPALDHEVQTALKALRQLIEDREDEINAKME
jgi:hypothetical protein